MKWWQWSIVPLLLAAQQSGPGERDRNRDDRGAFAEALAWYRDGAYERAQLSFERQLAAAGEDADPRLRLNAGLCALRLLRSNDAEQLVAPLFEHEQWRAEAAFVLGLAASQQAERSVAAARLPDADPVAWVMAVRAGQRAELLFRRACEFRADWPEAVRNLERTLRRRDEIQREREAAAPPDKKQENVPEQPPEQPKERETTEEVVLPEAALQELTAAELRKLQERVAEQRRRKLRSRRERSRDNGKVGARDW